MNKTIFSTCWYSLGAKFKDEVYNEWMDNMLSTATKYNLVVYTDDPTKFDKWSHKPNIQIVQHPIQDFVGYKTIGETFWRENHYRNSLLKNCVDWRVNMLWCEKVHFVENTTQQQYFNENPEETWYGWIDIGYFRCRPFKDVPRNRLSEIPNSECLDRLSRDSIHVILVNTNFSQVWQLCQTVLGGNRLPDNQISFGGGCFLAYGSHQIKQWREYFYSVLMEYVSNNWLIKDDQIIMATCIFRTINKDSKVKFDSHSPSSKLDPWFHFTSMLL